VHTARRAVVCCLDACQVTRQADLDGLANRLGRYELARSTPSAQGPARPPRWPGNLAGCPHKVAGGGISTADSAGWACLGSGRASAQRCSLDA